MKRCGLIPIGILLIQLAACTFLGFNRGPSHARIAAQYRSEKKYEEAIGEYRQHIVARLKDSRREPEENPYFYLILIGDIYLEQGNTAQALDCYIEANDKEVEQPLVVDRIRRVARVLSDTGKYREAVSLLNKYRKLDEFVFDLDIDENLKKIVKLEDPKR